MCGKEVPVAVSICDCMGHKVDGRKKGMEFIIKYFSRNFDEFDSKGSYTNYFFFDGAANVQQQM